MAGEANDRADGVDLSHQHDEHDHRPEAAPADKEIGRRLAGTDAGVEAYADGNQQDDHEREDCHGETSARTSSRSSRW